MIGQKNIAFLTAGAGNDVMTAIDSDAAPIRQRFQPIKGSAKCELAM
jgi:hypothetical protein